MIKDEEDDCKAGCTGRRTLDVSRRLCWLEQKAKPKEFFLADASANGTHKNNSRMEDIAVGLTSFFVLGLANGNLRYHICLTATPIGLRPSLQYCCWGKNNVARDL